jgi:hypothetical protein
MFEGSLRLVNTPHGGDESAVPVAPEGHREPTNYAKGTRCHGSDRCLPNHLGANPSKSMLMTRVNRSRDTTNCDLKIRGLPNSPHKT